MNLDFLSKLKKMLNILLMFLIVVLAARYFFNFDLRACSFFCKKKSGIEEKNFSNITKLQNEIKALNSRLSKAENTHFASEHASLKTDCSKNSFHELAGNLQKKCKNAVVKIIANQLSFDMQEPYRQPKQEEASGSGFFIDEEGYLLTNYHVVSFCLKVRFQMVLFGKEKFDCEIVGVCPDRDLALLKISENAKRKIEERLGRIEYLKLGNSDVLHRGQSILTLGFPLGKDVIISTAGIVSGWEEIPLNERGGSLSCLQIDAAINPGNSGGPSINTDGDVVGINFAGIAEAQNVGYVLPINELKNATKNLRSIKLLHKPELGIYRQRTTEPLCKYLKCNEDGGVYVRSILKKSLADQAGLQPGDVILEINGFKLDHYGDIDVPWREDKISFSNILHRLEIDDEISIIVSRNGKKKKLEVKLSQELFRPKVRIMFPGYEKIDYEVFGGLVIRELTLVDVIQYAQKNPKLIQFTDPENMNKSALFISFIQCSSEAHKNRGCISCGDLISSVNGNVVTTLDELRYEINSAIKKNSEFVTIETEDKSFTVFNLKNIIQDEPMLMNTFKYDKNHSSVAFNCVL